MKLNSSFIKANQLQRLTPNSKFLIVTKTLTIKEKNPIIR